MPQRRMFSKKIIDTDVFQDMPVSSQLLYFYLCMGADDDGFVGSPRRIMRGMTATEDDLKVLLSKRFLLAFDSGVIVIKHWRIHNLIRADLYSETTYLLEKGRLNLNEFGAYTEKDGKPLKEVKKPDYLIKREMNRERNASVTQAYTQDRIGKDRIGKDSKGITSSEKASDDPKIGFKQFKDDFIYNWNDVLCKNCPDIPKIKTLSQKRVQNLKARYRENEFKDNMVDLFSAILKSDFLSGRKKDWSVTVDWLIGSGNNYVKVLEGQYRNKEKEPDYARKRSQE